MKVVLVGIRHCDYEPSLALGMLKAYADARPGPRADIALLTFTTAEDPAAAAEGAALAGPDVVGLSCYLWNAGWAGRFAARLKELRPGVRVVLGGAEATSVPESLLARTPAADYLVEGEGEEAFAELLEALALGRDPAGLAGLYWRAPQGVRHAPARAARADLDGLPSPYEAGILPHGPRPHVCFEASRGCPFDCKYCDWQNKQRPRRYCEERAENDMALLLARLPEARVFVCDSDLFLDPRRGARLARAWRRAAKGRACTWEVHTYLPRLDDDALCALDSAQFTVCVGLQSTNPGALKKVSRFFDAERTAERAAAFRRLAPRARLNLQLIYGLPGDDPEGFMASLDYALALEPDSVMLFPALALPGSEMGRDPAAFGLRVQDRPPYRVLETEGFTAGALADADFLAFQLFILQRHRAAARVLCAVGRATGSPARAYSGFGAALAGTPFDLRPVYDRAARDLLGAVTHQEEPWSDIPPFERESGLLRLLGVYARGALDAAGASGERPALEASLAALRLESLWRELSASPGFHRLFESLVGAEDADTVWFGTEASAEAEGRFWPRAARWHWLDGPRPGEPCRRARHFAAADLGAPLADGAVLRGAVLSQVCGLLDGPGRALLLEGLRRRALPGARLSVFDAAAPGPLARELAGAGWRLRREPVALGAPGEGWGMLLTEAA